jgi:glycosyltransferase involved in cell wall biosynthesis
MCHGFTLPNQIDSWVASYSLGYITFMLTAIVPVSGMAGRLQNLESWLSTIQNLDIQVVIVHDFRDSETERQLISILESLNSPKIIFLSGTYGSPGAARNAGLDHVATNFVCFWDSDDLPIPQSIISNLEKCSEDYDVLVGQYVRCSNLPLEKNSVSSLDSSFQDIAMNPGLWRMVFRQDFIASLSFKTMRMGEDQLFIAEVMSLQPRLSFTNTLFYKYFVGHPGQLTRSRDAIIELNDAFREISILRKETSGREFEFNSIMISKMSFTLMKFAIFNDAKFKTFRSLMSVDILVTKHPILQIKCVSKVVFRMFAVTKHA